MKTKVLCILGPTASGKSALAISLAQTFDGEIISADSRQVYRNLDIGSGKVTKAEMKKVPHYLLDVANPKRQFSVTEYKSLAEKHIALIIKKGMMPIVVGGTGLYIDTLLQGLTFPEVAPNEKLRKVLEKKSAKQLFVILQKIDPKRARTIDKNNPRRLVRAIEVAKALGSVPKISQKKTNYDVLYIGLLPSPEILKKRISTRLSKRILGIVKEVRSLHAKGLSWKRMDELGLEYRYTSRYARGLISKKEMIESLEREIYQYAKRQMTWFKRNKNIHWFDPDKKNSSEEIQKLMQALWCEVGTSLKKNPICFQDVFL